MIQFVTYHGVDDEKIEQINARELFSKPTRGGLAAREDRALDAYFYVLETTGDHAQAQKAFSEVLQNQKQ